MTNSQRPLSRCRTGAGVLVVTEGLDGAGKTTHAKYLADYLNESMRWVTHLTREPGGTEFAMKLRKEIFFDPLMGETSDTVQALVIAAARRDHVEQVIYPRLVKGETVICDRFTLSTRMYQKDADYLDQILELGSAGVKPHVTLIFDVDYDVAAERIAKRAELTHQPNNWLDKISESVFNERRDILMAHYRQNPLSTFIIDANKPMDRVQSDVHQWMSRTLLPLISARLMIGDPAKVFTD